MGGSELPVAGIGGCAEVFHEVVDFLVVGQDIRHQPRARTGRLAELELLAEAEVRERLRAVVDIPDELPGEAVGQPRIEGLEHPPAHTAQHARTELAEDFRPSGEDGKPLESLLIDEKVIDPQRAGRIARDQKRIGLRADRLDVRNVKSEFFPIRSGLELLRDPVPDLDGYRSGDARLLQPDFAGVFFPRLEAQFLPAEPEERLLDSRRLHSVLRDHQLHRGGAPILGAECRGVDLPCQAGGLGRSEAAESLALMVCRALGVECFRHGIADHREHVEIAGLDRRADGFQCDPLVGILQPVEVLDTVLADELQRGIRRAVDPYFRAVPEPVSHRGPEPRPRACGVVFFAHRLAGFVFEEVRPAAGRDPVVPENDRLAGGVFVPAVVVELGPGGERFELEVCAEVRRAFQGDGFGDAVGVGCPAAGGGQKKEDCCDAVFHGV